MASRRSCAAARAGRAAGASRASSRPTAASTAGRAVKWIRPSEPKGAEHERSDGEGDPRRWMLLGDAGSLPEAARRSLDPGGVRGRRRSERDLPQSRHTRRGDRDRLRSRADVVSRAPRVLLPDPRPDDREPPGQRRGNELPLGDPLRRRRAAACRRGHDRSRRFVRAVAGEGRDGGGAGGGVLGGRARASGLPRAVPERLHLPLRATGVGPAHRGRDNARGRPRANARRPAQRLLRARRHRVVCTGSAAACRRARRRLSRAAGHVRRRRACGGA